MSSEHDQWEKVGEQETCDWCGRPGTVRQHSFHVDGSLVGRNPALCDVCFTMWSAPGDVIEAFAEEGVDFLAAIEEPMEAAFARRWQKRVREGTRHPQ